MVIEPATIVTASISAIAASLTAVALFYRLGRHTASGENDDLQTHIDTRFAEVHNRIDDTQDHIDGRLDTVNSRLDRISADLSTFQSSARFYAPDGRGEYDEDEDFRDP